MGVLMQLSVPPPPQPSPIEEGAHAVLRPADQHPLVGVMQPR
jgi:hypothetical protein